MKLGKQIMALGLVEEGLEVLQLSYRGAVGQSLPLWSFVQRPHRSFLWVGEEGGDLCAGCQENSLGIGGWVGGHLASA